jgi:hypothetical protein
MITDAFMEFLHGLAVALFGWLHDHLPSAPSVWTDASSAIASAVGVIPSAVLYFVPVGPVVTATMALLTVIVALGLLRLARRVLSLFTGGGGMA